jgi:hypothetical protein
MGVSESFGIYKTARRNVIRKLGNDKKLKNNKNNNLCIFYNAFYNYFSGIVNDDYVFVLREFKALFNEGSNHTRLFDWLYFKAFEALKELKNTPTSRKSHDQA